MPGLYQITWLPEGRLQNFCGSRGNYYELSESERLDLHSEPVWCQQCGKITHGESLSSLEKIDKDIRDLHDPMSDSYMMARNGLLEEFFNKGEEFLQERITGLQRRRRWRENRKSPPKCIHCGTTRILILPLRERIESPAGGGQLRIDFVGMCSTNFNEWFFTPEGDRIPRDTRPTYWHHPELDKPEHKKRFQDWLRSLPKRRDPPIS